MTIEKAIEILTYRSNPRHQYYDQKELPAIQLGIEALKWRLHLEKVATPAKYDLLPGETIE